MKTKTVVISLAVAALVVGAAFVVGLMAAFLSHSSRASGGIWPTGSAIGLISIEGELLDAKEYVEDIEDFRRNGSVKAIILRINTPGGSVAASQEIYEAARNAAQHKPVIASMGTVAASGGYYAALGATEIIANPGTITGSIGVRLDHLMLKDLLNWAKIRYEILKSGKYKDIGSFDRPLTSEEKKLLQDILDDIHAQFKAAVVDSRGLDDEEVAAVADGRVFTGREALEAKLVDRLGGLIEAVERAKELGNIAGEPKIIEPKRFRYGWLAHVLKGATDAVVGRAVERLGETHGQSLMLFRSTVR